eukprot:15216-Prymnesium_polylepis.3
MVQHKPFASRASHGSCRLPSGRCRACGGSAKAEHHRVRPACTRGSTRKAATPQARASVPRAPLPLPRCRRCAYNRRRYLSVGLRPTASPQQAPGPTPETPWRAAEARTPAETPWRAPEAEQRLSGMKHHHLGKRPGPSRAEAGGARCGRPHAPGSACSRPHPCEAVPRSKHGMLRGRGAAAARGSDALLHSFRYGARTPGRNLETSLPLSPCNIAIHVPATFCMLRQLSGSAA